MKRIWDLKLKIKINTIFYLIFLLVILSTGAVAQQSETVLINIAKIKEFVNESPITRNISVEKYLNNIVVAQGYVETVKKKNIYRRKYRIELIDNLNNGKLSIKYHVYTNNEEYMTLLNKGDLFEFKGQFVMYTPLNVKKDVYIFDIILEDGALVVE